MNKHRVPLTPADVTGARETTMHEAAIEHEHLMITHFSVIEGWLALLEDGMLDDAGRCRAASVMNERMVAMRTDTITFLADLKGGRA